MGEVIADRNGEVIADRNDSFSLFNGFCMQSGNEKNQLPKEPKTVIIKRLHFDNC